MKHFQWIILLIGLLAAGCTSLPGQTTSYPGVEQTRQSTAETTLATVTPSPSLEASATPTATPSGAWINLNPDSGGPGTTVQIDGYLPGGPTQSEVQNNTALSTTTVCWQGCLDGLTLENQPVKWSATEPGRFEISFSVPPIPWIGANGPQPVQPGDYSVGVQCLGPELSGCALKQAQASAVFHLQGTASQRCQPNQPCAQLTFTPAQASPGMTVLFTGWAPLTQVIGDQPSGYSLVIKPQTAQGQAQMLAQVQQQMDGSLSGQFTVPLTVPGQGLLNPGTYNLALQVYRITTGEATYLAVTPFEISAATAWSELNLGPPLWVHPSDNLIQPGFYVSDKNNGPIASCASNEIRVSRDGGQSWTSISTAQVAQVAAATGYPLMQQNASGVSPCSSLVLDGVHADSVYAVFETMNKTYGAPPVFYQGYVTQDGGKTWQQVPAPDPSLVENFGGFWTDENGLVQALYQNPSQASSGSPVAEVMQTSDGGATWNPGALVCPDSGPCMRWGAAPGSIPGMGSPLPQDVLVSQDGGSAWSAPGPSAELRALGPNQISAFDDQTALVITSMTEFPLQLTRDRGQSWQVITLPALPGSGAGSASYEGLQVLPDGSLITFKPDQSDWLRLAPGTSQWCSLQSPLPNHVVRLAAQGDRLWWYTGQSGNPEHAPLSDFGCAR
jgi:photosystem II stability/assembly factor-like uncharacterized protein